MGGPNDRYEEKGERRREADRKPKFDIEKLKAALPGLAAPPDMMQEGAMGYIGWLEGTIMLLLRAGDDVPCEEAQPGLPNPIDYSVGEQLASISRRLSVLETLALAQKAERDAHAAFQARYLKAMGEVVRSPLPLSQHPSWQPVRPSQAAQTFTAGSPLDSQYLPLSQQSVAQKLTDRARKAVQLGNQEAQRFGHAQLASVHLLLGLAKEGACIAAYAMRDMGVGLRELRLAVDALERVSQLTWNQLEMRDTLASAEAESKKFGHHYIGTEHLLLAICNSKDSSAAQVLNHISIDRETLRGIVVGIMSIPNIDGLAASIPDGASVSMRDSFREVPQAARDAMTAAHMYAREMQQRVAAEQPPTSDSPHSDLPLA